MATDEEFEQFVEQNLERLLRAARLMTGNWHAGSDLVQETLIRVYRAWARLENPAGAGSYARRTMVRLLIKQNKRSWSAEVPFADVPAPGAGLSEMHDELMAALAELPVRQRTVLVLRYYLDHSVATTARAMGISEGTVKSQTSKALQGLRHNLERQALEQKELSQ